jgi:hypothetical protein
MELVEINGVKLYRFPRLAAFPEVIHGVFTRQGGVSRGPYRSLNVSLAVGDLPQQVEENRRRVQQALRVERLISATQVHGVKEAVITGGHVVPPGEIPEADILITAQPGLGLVIKQADCQAVMFYDPEHRVVAHAHCGWRGQIAGILSETVARLAFSFGSRPGVVEIPGTPELLRSLAAQPRPTEGCRPQVGKHRSGQSLHPLPGRGVFFLPPGPGHGPPGRRNCAHTLKKPVEGGSQGSRTPAPSLKLPPPIP